MKITAENEYAKVEINLSITSPTKALISEEITDLQLDLADKIIEDLGRLTYAKFSVAGQEIKVQT